MFPKRNQEAQQQWRVSREENDRVTIRNKKSNLYLSFQGKIFLGQFLSLTQEKRPWKLSSPFGAKYSIESVEEYLGTRLTANKSPPRGGTHLVMLDYPDKTQDPEWSFKLIEETYEQPRQYRLPYEKARGCH
ncbi:hypothetical protein BGW38_010343 [Lunasporangiospora selenospora]|uniref:Uncharacterized protein n=1 Tax=Lunasporangiospora selenospora TaxID=979761 RepID=A0A9P6FX70_9FUNG|nr:hypothetical protein BGW38_010343 [Lunasporangiospora selenospora]